MILLLQRFDADMVGLFAVGGTAIYLYRARMQQNKNFVAFAVGMWYNRGAKSFAAVRKTVLGAFMAFETIALYFLARLFCRYAFASTDTYDAYLRDGFMKKRVINNGRAVYRRCRKYCAFSSARSAL